MIDVHSHILPGMDDGSKSPEDSIAMLKIMQEQGVETVVATSHFYADRETLERFLERRAHAERRLRTAMSEAEIPFPKVILGAEVWYFDGISHSSDALKPLRTEGTQVLLLEMPFSRWTDHMLQEASDLNEADGFTVILAHVERYLKWQKKSTWEWLAQHEIGMQLNAEAFLERKTARKALKLLKQQQVHVLGSDCHNLTSRPPNYGKAIQAIRSSLGEEAVSFLAEMERRLYLEPEEVY